MTCADLSVESTAAGGSSSLRGYLATPSGTGPFPGVVMIHEAFGLNDMTRRHADPALTNLGIEHSVNEFPTAGHAYLKDWTYPGERSSPVFRRETVRNGRATGARLGKVGWNARTTTAGRP